MTRQFTKSETIKVNSSIHRLEDNNTTLLIFPIPVYGDYIGKMRAILPKNAIIKEVTIDNMGEVFDSYNKEILALDPSDDVIDENNLYHNLKFWFRNKPIPTPSWLFGQRFISITLEGQYLNAQFQLEITYHFTDLPFISYDEQITRYHYQSCNAIQDESGSKFHLQNFQLLYSNEIIIKTDMPLTSTDKIIIQSDGCEKYEYCGDSLNTNDNMKFTLLYYNKMKNTIITIPGAAVKKIEVCIQFYDVIKYKDISMTLASQHL